MLATKSCNLFSFLAVSQSLQGSYTSKAYHQSPRYRNQLQVNSYNSYTPRNTRNNHWGGHYAPAKLRYGANGENANLKSLPGKTDPRTEKTIVKAKNLATNAYLAQRPTAKKAATFSLPTKRLLNKKIVQRPLKDRSTVKKATLSANPRWTRSRGERKKKKQFIVANYGGLGLGNGLGLGLTGTTADSYSAGLTAGLGTAAYGTGAYGAGAYGTGFNTGLSNDYGAGLGTVLATGYGTGGTNVLGSNAVLSARHNFGTNYGAASTSNDQSQTALSDLSAAGLNSLTSTQAGGVNSYVSNLGAAGGAGISDLSSLNSLSSYQNNGLDMLGNTGNTATTGLSDYNSVTGGLSQSQQQLGEGSDNLLNSLEEKLNMGTGGRQGIGGRWTLKFYLF